MPREPSGLALIDETNTPETVGGSLWVIWLAVAALAPAFWPSGPRGALDFFLLVPLDLLAALTVADLVNRRMPVRSPDGFWHRRRPCRSPGGPARICKGRLTT